MQISKRAGVTAAAVAVASALGGGGIAIAEAQEWPGEPACLQGEHAGDGQMKVDMACTGSEPPPPGPEGYRVSVAVPHGFDPACQWTSGSEGSDQKPLFWIDPSRQYKPYFCDA